MEKKLEFYYIRHADTCGAGCGDRCPCDIDLSPLGEKQIELLAARFEGQRFDYVLSSPLVRCVKTAAAVCKRLEGTPKIEIVPHLIENGTVPGYTGADIDYLRRYYDNIALCEDSLEPFGSNMTDEENDERAFNTAKYLKIRFALGDRVLIFCHGSFGNHLIPAMVEMGKGNYILSLSNTGVTKMKFTPDGRQRISFLNDISHLRPLMPEYEFDT